MKALILLILLALPLPSLAGSMLVVPVTLTYQGRSITVDMALDTGASTTTISGALADRIGIDQQHELIHFAQMADGRTVPYSSTTMDIDVAGMIQRGTPVNIMNYSGERGRIDGFIGLSFIKEFVLTLDLKNNRILWGNRTGADQ